VTSRGARTARGATIAAFATFVASLAHTVGGGAPPGPLAILLALAFSLPLAMLLAGPGADASAGAGVAVRARLARTSISALVAQAALHLCYALGAASVPIPTATTGHAGHHGPGVAMPFDAAMAAPVIDHGHALMPFAHLVAAALTVVALALADSVFDVVQRCVRMLVRRLTSLPTPAVLVPLREVDVVADLPRLVGVRLRSALWSRGPPAMVAAS
jgi:hypothetical protein